VPDELSIGGDGEPAPPVLVELLEDPPRADALGLHSIEDGRRRSLLDPARASRCLEALMARARGVESG
jgi:hypothetical protein